jgi:hypothetical protein
LDAQADQVVQRLVDEHHEVTAEREFAVSPKALVRAELLRSADAGFGSARKSVAAELHSTGQERIGDFLFARFGLGSGDSGCHRFAENAGWFTMFIAVDDSVGRVRRRGGDVRQPESDRICDGNVVAGPPEEDRVVWGDVVEILTGRVALFVEGCLIVTLSDDPGAGGRVTNARGDEFPDLGNRLDTGRGEGELGLGESGHHDVGVGVVETGAGETALEIDISRRADGMLTNFIERTHSDYASKLQKCGIDEWSIRVHGENWSTVDKELLLRLGHVVGSLAS